MSQQDMYGAVVVSNMASLGKSIARVGEIPQSMRPLKVEVEV
jgi:hypothetical protein